MAADRQRLAQALAAEAARRKMFESIPEPAGQGFPQAPEATNYGRDLENLSIGLGRGAVNQLEGLKGLVTSPVESLKGMATGAMEAVRNPRMIAEALKRTGERGMSGPLGLGEVIGENVNIMRMPGKPVMSELDVYHGTPHRFPVTEANPLGEFDASKIGTGEGAQAYGHGIYYAESPKVASSYATMNQASAPSRASFIRLRDQAPQGSAEWNHYDNLAKEGVGSLYKADLPDEMIDRMLDWDKPLSEQPEAIQEIARKVGIGKAAGRTKAKLQAFIEGTETPEMGRVAKGGDLYLALSDYGNESIAGSRALQEAGILGIKYRDAGSRGAGGTGTRNFVVFPGEEKKVRILERK